MTLGDFERVANELIRVKEENKELKKQLEKRTKMYQNAYDYSQKMEGKAIILETQQKDLKEQLNKTNDELYTLKNKYNIRLLNQISENIESDCEDHYLAEIETKANKYDLIQTQQKAFIKYLEDETSKWHNNYDSYNCEYEVEEPTAEELANKILQKYKSIIGVSDENSKN